MAGSIMKRLEALERSINRRSRQIILEVDGNLPVDEAAEAESTALRSFATSAAAPGNA
jgi:pentose-5-phosphate-3-epimerase